MENINRSQFLKTAAFTSLAAFFSWVPFVSQGRSRKNSFQFRLLRHATLVLEVGGKKILLDPMLSKKDALDPIANASNTFRIPMVDLPLSDEELGQLLREVDAVIITHTHRDHWDISAQQRVAKDKLIICQPADALKLKEQGFTNVQVVEKSWQWDEINLHRTDGQHGTGEIRKKLGTVSGFVIDYQNNRLYIAGDTIWCDDVSLAIATHHPTHIVINGGGARFVEGDPITMTTDDMQKVAAFTNAKITVVHLDTINHCLQRRTDFNESIAKHNLSHQVFVPKDGDWVTL